MFFLLLHPASVLLIALQCCDCISLFFSAHFLSNNLQLLKFIRTRTFAPFFSFFFFFCFLLNSNTYFAGRRHARSAKDCNMWIKSLTTAAHSKHTCTCTYRWTGTVGRRSEQFALYLQRFFLLLLVSFALLSPHFSNRFAVLFIYSFFALFPANHPDVVHRFRIGQNTTCHTCNVRTTNDDRAHSLVCLFSW